MSETQIMQIIEDYFRNWQRIAGGSDTDVYADCWSAMQCYDRIQEAAKVRLEYDDLLDAKSA